MYKVLLTGIIDCDAFLSADRWCVDIRYALFVTTSITVLHHLPQDVRMRISL